MKTLIIKCIVCDKKFTRKNDTQKYCSHSCRNEMLRTINIGRSNDNGFKKGNIPHNKYLVPIKCTNCNKLFQPREKKTKYCSKECTDTLFEKGHIPKYKGTIGIKKGYNWTEEEKEKIRIRNSGSASHFWKGGISKLNYHIRRIAKYVQWRTECFVRDNFICQECGKRGGRLQVHHKKSFELILKENKITTIEQAINCPELWDTDNGITLCISCHTQTDTYAKNLK